MDKCIYQPLLNDKELEHLNLDNFQSVVVNFKAYFGAALSRNLKICGKCTGKSRCGISFEY